MRTGGAGKRGLARWPIPIPSTFPSRWPAPTNQFVNSRTQWMLRISSSHRLGAGDGAGEGVGVGQQGEILEAPWDGPRRCSWLGEPASVVQGGQGCQGPQRLCVEGALGWEGPHGYHRLCIDFSFPPEASKALTLGLPSFSLLLTLWSLPFLSTYPTISHS